jgi:hypothetical protein
LIVGGISTWRLSGVALAPAAATAAAGLIGFH